MAKPNPPKTGVPQIFQGTGCANGTEYSKMLAEKKAAEDRPVYLSAADAAWLRMKVLDAKLPKDGAVLESRLADLQTKIEAAFPYLTIMGREATAGFICDEWGLEE